MKLNSFILEDRQFLSVKRVAADAAEDRHAAAGEGVRRAHGEERGQLEDGVHARGQRHPRPGPLAPQRRLAPLGEVPGHAGDDPVAARPPAGLGDVPFVAPVEGVVLGDDARDLHALASFPPILSKNAAFDKTPRDAV